MRHTQGKRQKALFLSLQYVHTINPNSDGISMFCTFFVLVAVSFEPLLASVLPVALLGLSLESSSGIMVYHLQMDPSEFNECMIHEISRNSEKKTRLVASDGSGATPTLQYQLCHAEFSFWCLWGHPCWRRHSGHLYGSTRLSEGLATKKSCQGFPAKCLLKWQVLQDPRSARSSSAKFFETLVTEESAKKNEPGTWASPQPAEAAVRVQHTGKFRKAGKTMTNNSQI